jgi:hypothetical protein
MVALCLGVWWQAGSNTHTGTTLQALTALPGQSSQPSAAHAPHLDPHLDPLHCSRCTPATCLPGLLGLLRPRHPSLPPQVFLTSRPSIPDLDLHACSAAHCQVLRFDSLHDKLTQLPGAISSKHSGQPGQGQGQGQGSKSSTALQPAPPLVWLRQIAGYLRQALGLSLFGFDVVVDACSGDLLVIDINYFPNYRDSAQAPGLLRACLRTRWEQQCVACCHSSGD